MSPPPTIASCRNRRSSTSRRQSLDRARRLRDASEAKLDAGLVSQLDVLRSQQLVAQAEMQLFDAQSAVEDARDQLTFLMGRETTDPFDGRCGDSAAGHGSRST